MSNAAVATPEDDGSRRSLVELLEGVRARVEPEPKKTGDQVCLDLNAGQQRFVRNLTSLLEDLPALTPERQREIDADWEGGHVVQEIPAYLRRNGSM